MQNDYIFDSMTEIMEPITNNNINNNKVHLRIRQRNSRKSYTIIENLPDNVNLSDLARDMRKKLSCNSFVKSDEIIGKYIQLFGDQRVAVKKILIDANIVHESDIIIHGY